MLAVFSHVLFVIVFLVIFLAKVKKTKNSNAQNNNQTNTPSGNNNHVDGNGRTEAQNKYIAELRKRAAQNKVNADTARSNGANADVAHDGCQAQADAHAHEHLGREEHYEPIVGSLGEDSDEGCPDLDGVRLIAHDVAYDDTDGETHFDRTRLARAMILGEVLNKPRFKGPKGR